MADLIGPFDSVPWSEGEWYNFAPTWAPSGIIGSPAASISAGDFAVTASGLTLTVACTGDRAWIDGSGYKPDSDKTLPVTANANASLSRRDRIVIRRDLAAKTIAVVRLAGTPASGTPAAPALTQVTGGVFDAPICSFLVPPNNGTTLSSFVDERVWIETSWTAYTPTLNALGGGLVEGPKTNWAGRWVRQGMTVTYEFNCTLGTGFAQGAGAFELTTPVAPAAPPTAAPAGLIVGSAWLWSGSTTAIAAVRVKPNGRLEFLHHGNAANNPLTGAAAPWAWSPNATIAGSVTYEAA